MRKKLILLTALLFLTACNRTSEESSDANSLLELTTTTSETSGTDSLQEHTTTSETSGTSESSASQAAPSWDASWLTRVTPELPTQFPEVDATCVDGFHISDYVSDPDLERVGITAVDGDTILFTIARGVRVGNGSEDHRFFKYEISSKKVTMLEGVIPREVSGSGISAIGNGKFYTTSEVISEDDTGIKRVHYVVDCKKNRVEVLQQETLIDEEEFTGSTHETYPVNDSEYVEVWTQWNWVGYQRIATCHMKWYHADGTSEDLLPDTTNPDRTISADVTNDNKIYDITSEGEEDVLYVYDMQLQMLSHTPMPELTAVLRELKERYHMEYDVPIGKICVFGDYIGFNLGDGSGHTLFLYNKAIGKVFTLEDCFYLSPNCSVGKDANCHLFYRTSWIENTDKYHTEIFSIDNAGNITAVMASDIEDFCTDGKTLAYIKDDQLYYMPL